jgi:predicted dehydrogenase
MSRADPISCRSRGAGQGEAIVAVRIAIVGCGYIAQAEHVPALLSLQPEAKVVAAVDVQATRAAAVAAPFAARSYTALRDALRAEEIDAVVLCTRAPTHLVLLKEAAAAGKVVLLEKPLAYSLAEAREAIDVVRRTGIRCMLGYQRRYDDDCLHVREAIHSGAIGEIRAAVSLCRLALPSHFRPYSELPPRPAVPTGQDLEDDWLSENSIHHINLLRFWLGDVARIHSAVYRAPDHNLGVVTLEFAHGVIVSHHQLRGMEEGEEITLYGTKGNLRVQLWYPHRPYTCGRVVRFAFDPPRWEEHAVRRTSPYINQMAHFLRFVRRETGSNSGVEDSYRDLELLCEIRRCAIYVGGTVSAHA